MEASNVKAMREALDAINHIDTRMLKRLFYKLIKANIFDGGQISKTISAVEKVRQALSAPPRNCDRPECATTKEAQDVWCKEDGGKTAYYEWLLATSTKGEAK